MPPTGLAHKGRRVEEWADLRFFRPAGLRVAQALGPTAVSADQVTVAAMVIGLVGAHLFFYRNPALNWAGLALLIGSDVLDSADGQLARIRGASSRWGRMLDGISDNVRFVALYLHLGARLLVGGAPPAPIALGAMVAAGLSQSAHAAVADFLRQAFLWLRGDKNELDLPEDLPAGESARPWHGSYRRYLLRQTTLCPETTSLVRAARAAGDPARWAASWTAAQQVWIGRLALIGTNIRFPLLAAMILAQDPMWFFWATIGPLNVAFAWILIGHERNARGLAARPPAPQVPVVTGAA